MINPAFGFKQSDMDFRKYYKYAIQNNKLSHLVSAIKNNCPSLAHSDSYLLTTLIQAEEKKKLMGYIPIIGALYGIARIHDALIDDEDLLVKVSMVFRGLLEIACLGWLLSVLDLIVTSCRPVSEIMSDPRNYAPD